MEPEITDQMARLGATDTCHLHVANSELRLLCAKDGRLLVAWPFTCLRRYMSTRGKFTVEAGRRAPTGQGKFTFLTPQHDEIYKFLDNVVKSRASHKPSSSSHESLRKTQSVPIATAAATKDIPPNGYDHLASTPVSSSATDHQLSPGKTNSMKNTFSAPYGHLPSWDTAKSGTPLIGQGVPQVVPGSRLSVESEEGDQYNTLIQPVHGANEPQLQQGQQGVSEAGYNILDRHLASPQDGEYNVLDRGPKSRTASQHQQQGTEDVYNVIGETLHPVTLPAGSQANKDVYNTLSTSQSNTAPLSTSATEETYNTLDHGSPARSPHKASHHTASTDSQGSVRPPKPTTRKLFEPVNKQSSSVPEGDDTHNKATRRPPPPVRKTPEMFQKSQSVDEGGEMYNTLDMSKSRPPAPSRKTSEQLRKLQKSQSLSVDESSDMYNTLDTVTQPPVQPRKTHINKQTSLDSDEMYNTLDTTRVSTPPVPARQKSSSSAIEGDDMYNTLDTARVGPDLRNEGMDNVMASNLLRNDDDMYNTLDTKRTGSSLSVPVPPQRSFLSHGGTGSPRSSPGKRDTPELKRNSTSTMQSVRCPLDASPSLSKTRPQASSLDDLDSYASIDYAALSPPKSALKHPPIPVQRSGPSKGRKTSAPDILSFAGHPSGKEFKKPGKGGLVSNLKASLEAGGLDLTKLQRKPKKLSREGSEELSTYAEVDEQGANQALADDVFAPGTPPTRPARSQSSPSEGKAGEDIYDELDQSAQLRPKSLQITKAKKNAKK